MKIILSCALPVVAFFLSVASASASEKVQVQASPDFRVAVVSADKPDAERRAVQDAMGASLAASLSRQCNGKVNVKMVPSEVYRSVTDLSAGNFDAILFIGETLPSAYRKAEFATSRAVSDIGVPIQVFHMVVRSDDPSLTKMASAAFESAMISPRFVEVLTHAASMKVSANSR
jgi:hypothetical protein